MEALIRKYSSIPPKFIDDFYSIAKESYIDTKPIIKFEIVYKWLETDKYALKQILIANFTENIDYTLEKIKVKNKNRGSNYVDHILITPDCFKEICMISFTKKAKEVRLFYLELEKFVKKYNEDFKEALKNNVETLRENQKPKIDIKGGVIYIIEALNTEDNILETVNKFKIGKTKNIKKRLNTYNSGNANNINPIFVTETDDIDSVEKCVKLVCIHAQYRNNKEIYEIELEKLKNIIENCSNMINDTLKTKKIYVGKLSRTITDDTKTKYYVKFEKEHIKSKTKSKSKSKSKTKKRVIKLIN
jgi:phage anti-repressor protein